MIKVDLHCHTIFSSCGVHTIIEMLEYGRQKGLKALAITDHGSASGGKVNSVFWERLENPVKGIKLLKGLEANVLDEKGNIDFPEKFLKYADIVLLGLHGNISSSLDENIYTDMLIKAMEKNIYVDIISHPTDEIYRIDFLSVIKKAKEMGIALELSNTKLMYNRVDIERVKFFLKLCKENKAQIALSSDAHTINEIGTDNYIRPILKEVNFPEELIINSSVKKAFQYINQRRKYKI